MSGWFGKSWGAPACDPEEHFATPVGEACMRCGEPITESDQGIIMPVVNPDLTSARVRPWHLDCLLEEILSHGPECPRCRGREREGHKMDCAYRRGGGECECWRTWSKP